MTESCADPAAMLIALGIVGLLFAGIMVFLAWNVVCHIRWRRDVRRVLDKFPPATGDE